MKYIADDGKVFGNEQDCLAYENGVKAKKVKEEQEKKAKEEKIKKIEDQIKEYKAKIIELQKEHWDLVGFKYASIEPLHLTNSKELPKQNQLQQTYENNFFEELMKHFVRV